MFPVGPLPEPPETDPKDAKSREKMHYSSSKHPAGWKNTGNDRIQPGFVDRRRTLG